MKSDLSEDTNVHKRNSWFSKLRFLLTLIAIAISFFYIIIIRPYLMPTMSTVKFELVLAVVVALALCIVLVILILTLLITLIMAITTRKRLKIIPWVLKLRRQFIVMVVLGGILVILVLLSQWLAYTPPIVGEDGKALPGSVSKLEEVTLNGSKQWITIRGKNKNNPVLLFLAGGPGGSQLAATREQLSSLEEHFVVVNWEQPGSGKSYHAVPLESITPERYISDAHELTLYLCKTFEQEKIYMLGESWGSSLGILVAQRYPQLYKSFIGTGQIVDFDDTEKICYQLAMKLAKEGGDIKKLQELKNQGAPPYYGSDVTWKSSKYLMYLSSYMTKNPNISNPGYNTLGDLSGPEYGLYDKVNYLLGILNTFNHVYPQLYKYDLRKQAVNIDIPVYFIQGRYDVNAPLELAKEYYSLLDAPKKELIWFEHSGHSPWINERDKFVDVVVDLFK